MTDNPRTRELLHHLATRPGHDEVKSDFRQLLVEEFGVELGALDFERRVPEVRGRLDALIGRTVFEAKRNLDHEWDDVVRRMPDYLADREREESERFVGIASDGLKWVVFERNGDQLVKLKETTLDPEKADLFLGWLNGALALKSALPPDPVTVRIELGQDSVAFRRANDGLRAIWQKVKGDPAVTLKRQLWAQLLKLVYGREVESDGLFFQHTFLVIVAKAIALAVLGLRDDDPRHVLSGAAFESAGIFGAAESDFFDWVVAEPEGEALVRRILVHVRRFRLDQVESDVLKILYESLIDREERHGLGEYYTPDWLAAKIVRHAVERPIEQRVLDPACGSGTFLFHAIRDFLKEAEEAGLEEKLRAEEATNHIAGMDIHPVAVIIARVTYLLALAPVIAKRAGSLSIPVYLGDSLQLSTATTMHLKELVVHVPPPPEGTELKFPEMFCKDIHLFDKLVAQMRQGSEQKPKKMSAQQIEQVFQREIERHYKRDMTKAETDGVREMVATYVAFDKLREQGRDSVWTYVARNLSRPLALSFGAGWANVVVGNPPWLAFRYMSADLQKRFRSLATGERVYVGGKFATQNDLSALFLVRAAALYLRSGGRIAFVLPLAALTRGQFEKFRKGSFSGTRIAWDEAWTMDDNVQPLFPVPSCVVFGRRRATAKALPDTVRAYSGQLPLRDASEAQADAALKVRENAPKPAEGRFKGGSAYRKSFRQGATLVPRMLCLVERKSLGRLGGDPTAPFVVSRRNNQEKQPWKSLAGVEHRVEAEFLYPVLLGESILPYRLWRPFEGAVPVTAEGAVLDAQAAANRGYSGLHGWLSAAEAIWNGHRPSDISLIQQFDYYGKLTAQFPLRRLRVVYAASGTIPAACVLRTAAVIEHAVYWAEVSTDNEGHYLAALMNSETSRARVAAIQARGQWGARHFDKVMFTLPIPRFDAAVPLHNDLAAAAAEAERIAAAFELPPTVKFQRARKLIRDALTESGIAPHIDELVARLLDESPTNEDDPGDN